jgi:hypothetical protein
MSERGDFEAEELRGLAERYGGRRVVVEPATKHHPAVHAYQFPALCWCCPMWQRVELVLRPGETGRSWETLMCPHGCRSTTEEGALSKPCPSALPGHAGYRHQSSI